MDVTNIPELASELARLLGPYLPALIETGKAAAGKAVEEVGKKAGGEAFEGAKKVWGRLRGKVEEDPAGKKTLETLVRRPEDSRAQGAFELLLEDVLTGEPTLAGELAKLLEAAGTKVNQTAKTHGSGNATAQLQGSGHTVNQTIQNFEASRPGPDEKSLRSSYLNHLMERSGYLRLSEVFPNSGVSERGARLSLDAIYTGLSALPPKSLSQDPKQDGISVLHESRQFSALEQLNCTSRLVLLGHPGSGKTTFVNFVSLCMAGDILNHSKINRHLLTSPLPADDGKDSKERQLWEHGALIPVRVRLSDFAARGLPKRGRATAEHLWKFIERLLQKQGLKDYFRYLRNNLLSPGGLVLLDGLDEVPQGDKCREQVRDAVVSFAQGLPLTCRILVTSRFYYYKSQGWKLEGFSEAVLVPFSEGQIRRFAYLWYSYMASLKIISEEEVESRAEQLRRAIFTSKALRELAERPLLMTLIANLHATRGEIILKDREEIYNKAVDLLLDAWERYRPRVDDKEERDTVEPSLAAWFRNNIYPVRQVLSRLAFELHSSQEDAAGTAELSQEKLIGGLLAIRKDQKISSEDLSGYLSQRSGLLEERGEGIFVFPHRIFQEYLAACHLAGEDSFPSRIAELGRAGLEKWREVVLLAGAKAYAGGVRSNFWVLLNALCYRETTDLRSNLADAWGAYIACKLLLETVPIIEVLEHNKPQVQILYRWADYLVKDGAVEELGQRPIVKINDSDMLQLAPAVELARLISADSGFSSQIAQIIKDLEQEKIQFVEIRGSVVVVQGDANVVTGLGAHITGRDIHTSVQGLGSNDVFLQRAYFQWVMEQTDYQALLGMDPAVKASDREVRLSLGAVYIGLRTFGAQEAAAVPGGSFALDQLNKHPHLVLLGAPGSGKSTFISMLALCMAGELLGSPIANLSLLTSVEEGEKSQAWDHGPLLPIRVILRDFAALGLPRPGAQATARHLWEFIKSVLNNAGLAEAFPLVKRTLQERGGLLLLDGLDEVPEAEARRDQIRQAIESFVKGVGKGCRVLLTSRTYAYRNQGWSFQGFEEAELAPFNNGQIDRGISRWYSHIATLGRVKAKEAEDRAQQLKQAIFKNDRLHELAKHPLLLTLIASLHARRGGSLPERREELYADAVELLLDFWERQRLRVNAKGEYELLQPSFAEWLKVDQQKVRQILSELAFEIHNSQVGSEGTADLTEEKLVGRLLHMSQNPDVNPKQLIEYLSQRSGLLVARGAGVYSFPHRGFQEYLAACHLTGESFPKQVADLGRSGLDRWREVVLLAGAKAARGSTASVWQLVDALCWREPGDPASDLADAWGALLAGQVMVESADLAEIAEWNRPKLERLRGWLVRLLRDKRLPAVERALAGDSLARMGDPRIGVMTVDGMEFCEVPAGTFWMGSGNESPEADWHEKPQHNLEIPYSYRIARYPVTMAQFREYAVATGIELRTRHVLDGLSNRPTVGVSWFEALSFCKWLTRSWRQEGRIDVHWEVRLPSEAEWEKAARGTDGRRFPWGDAFDPERVNASETGIARPSAVGCFPAGVSPYGCEEMSGNVWEWTRSVWGGNISDPSFCYPYRSDDGREDSDASSDQLRVLRGGAYIRYLRSVRCAFRIGVAPVSRNDLVGFRIVVAPTVFAL